MTSLSKLLPFYLCVFLHALAHATEPPPTLFAAAYEDPRGYLIAVTAESTPGNYRFYYGSWATLWPIEVRTRAEQDGLARSVIAGLRTVVFFRGRSVITELHINAEQLAFYMGPPGAPPEIRRVSREKLARLNRSVRMGRTALGSTPTLERDPADLLTETFGGSRQRFLFRVEGLDLYLYAIAVWRVSESRVETLVYALAPEGVQRLMLHPRSVVEENGREAVVFLDGSVLSLRNRTLTVPEGDTRMVYRISPVQNGETPIELGMPDRYAAGPPRARGPSVYVPRDCERRLRGRR